MSNSFSLNHERRKSILIIAIIIVSSTAVCILFYSYFQFMISEIDGNSQADIQKSSRIETYQLSKMLSSNLDAISNNLEVLSKIPAIQRIELENAKTNINLRQDSTEHLTDFYGWTDSNGNIIYSSNFRNETLNQIYYGTNIRNQSLFKLPNMTHLPYFGSSEFPFDDNLRFYISYPILENSKVENSNNTNSTDLSTNKGDLKGIVFAGIPVNKLNMILMDHISPESKIRAGLIDGNGILLQGRKSTYLGKSVFGPEFQSTVFPSIIPNKEKDQYNNFINMSLINSQQSKNKSVSGWDDFTLDGIPTTVAYRTIYPQEMGYEDLYINNNNHDANTSLNSQIQHRNTITNTGDQNNNSINRNFLLLYTSTPHVLLGSVNALIDNMKNLGTILIIAISCLAILSTIIILSWNDRLNQKVRERTAELKKANDDLIEKEELQREFINVAAHELRTPTQAISGYTEFDNEIYNELSKDIKTEIDKHELEKILTILYNHHTSISRNTSRLENLINNLLDVARIDSGKNDMIMLHRENFDLVVEIKDIIAIQLVQKLKDKNIQVNFINEFLDESSLVYADRSRVSQILTNLIDNAIKFSKKMVA